jgi:hypothetical protein
MREAGFTATRCWLEERRERFAAAVVAGVSSPLDYVRLNASAVRGPT